jgi:hypothetical protein
MIDWLIKKATTKPFWYWDRCRPYPIRFRICDFEPIESQGDIVFVVLSTPKTFFDGLWSAWSAMRFLSHLVTLHLFVDGVILPSYQSAVRRLFPGAQLHSLREYVAKTEMMEASWYQRLAPHHPLSHKLALLLALQVEHSVLYSDSDVLFFSEPDEIISALSQKSVPLYLGERGDHHDPWIVSRAGEVDLCITPGFNSGLLWIPKNSFSPGIVSNLLDGWEPPVTSWYTEQSTLSVLMNAAQAQSLPMDRYVIHTGRRFYWEKDVDYRAIIARHFVTPVRHVMYLKGMPYLMAQRSNP